MLKGSIVALATPFTNDDKLDIEALKRLVRFHLDNDTDGILVAGCTGESFTLTDDERESLLSIVLEAVDGELPVLAGCGAPSLWKAKQLATRAKKLGADYALVITPYGNKPSQEGMYRYFSEIAEVASPVVLYNVPSRTGRSLDPETVIRLSSHPNIVGIKEASGKLDNVSKIVKGCDISVLSGDDSLTLPMLTLGAVGVISTVANITPRTMHNMIEAFENGDIESARKLHLRMFNLIKALFIESNPQPLKYALSVMGLCEGNLRPPLAPISETTANRLKDAMHEAGLIT